MQVNHISNLKNSTRVSNLQSHYIYHTASLDDLTDRQPSLVLAARSLQLESSYEYGG